MQSIINNYQKLYKQSINPCTIYTHTDTKYLSQTHNQSFSRSPHVHGTEREEAVCSIYIILFFIRVQNVCDCTCTCRMRFSITYYLIYIYIWNLILRRGTRSSIANVHLKDLKNIYTGRRKNFCLFFFFFKSVLSLMIIVIRLA